MKKSLLNRLATIFMLVPGLLVLVACSQDTAPPAVGSESTGSAKALEDVVRMTPVETPKGTFEVWTRKVGDSPTMKVLLLHGGPGFTHEYLKPLAEYLPAAGIEVYLYDQLGSYFSDQPDDPDLWEIPRFVDEVEQVRQALGLGHRQGLAKARELCRRQVAPALLFLVALHLLAGIGPVRARPLHL